MDDKWTVKAGIYRSFSSPAANSIIIGRDNTALHEGVILIGSGLTSQAAYEVRVGNGESACVFTPDTADFALLRDTLLELMHGFRP